MSARTVRLKAVAANPVRKSDGSKMSFLALEDIESGTGRLLTASLPSKSANDAVLYQGGDVLFGKLRPYLAKSYLPTANGSSTGELIVIRPSGVIDSRYLFYVTLSSPWLNWSVATSYGAKMPRTSWDNLGQFEIWLPPLEGQRRIADFLDAETSRIDRLADRGRRMTAIIRERIQAVIDNVVLNSAVRTAKLFWLLEILRDGTHQPPVRIDRGIRFLTARNVSSGVLRTTEYDSFVSEADAAALERSLQMRAGDLLLSVKGTIGACAVVPDMFERAVLDRNLALLRPLPGVSSEWLAFVLRSRQLQEQMRLSIAAAAQPGLPLGAIRELRVPDMETAEQYVLAERLAKECDRSDRVVRAIEARQALLAERRQALITAAVTGQFDVTTASGRNTTQGV
jgi:type I restriction enzyme S subunit